VPLTDEEAEKMLADIGDAFGKVETDDTPPLVSSHSTATSSSQSFASTRPWSLGPPPSQASSFPSRWSRRSPTEPRRNTTPPTHLAAVDQWVRRATVHPINSDTARIFADIRIAIERVGKPIPVNDIWIAATCVRHGVELATLDLHLTGIPNLSTTVPF